MGSRNSCSSYSSGQNQEIKNLGEVDDEKVLGKRGYTLSQSKVIGTGTYAKVKLAFSRKHYRNVAIKIVNRDKAPEDFISKFLPRELSIFRRLSHDNIIYCHEILEAGPKVYIVMDYAIGGDLLEYIRMHKFINEEKACKMFRRIMVAIHYLHSLSIAHRDLKCENVLLDHHNCPKLTDFGFAKRIHNKRELCETYCGSSAYAPREILTGKPYDPFQSDIWSVGVILYIMTTGTMPFDDSSTSLQLAEMDRGPSFRRIKQPISDSLRQLLCGILNPVDQTRFTIRNIMCDQWVTHDVNLKGAAEAEKEREKMKILWNNANKIFQMRTDGAKEKHRDTGPKPGDLKKPNGVQNNGQRSYTKTA